MTAVLHRRPPPQPDPTAARQDAVRLAALVRECVLAGIPRRACVIHLSRLPPERTRPHHLRLAKGALEPLANADRARLFDLPSNDIVVIWRGPAEKAVATSRSAMAELFADENGREAAGLWEDLELPQAAGRLLDLADAQAEPRQVELPPSAGATPLDTGRLAALEATLIRTDVSRFARRRQFCALQQDGSFQMKWERRYLSVVELCASLAPDYDLQADAWLFRRLTRTLDRRMLSLLAAPDELTGAGPFAIALNVGSILAPEFLRFDNALPSLLRGHVTLDLHPADLMADPAAFLFARDFAHARGYRLQLRNIGPDLLDVVHRRDVGVDLVQLRWHEALEDIDLHSLRDDLDNVVLAHTDTPRALAWGRAQGITLYQGRMAMAGLPRIRRG